MDYVIPVYSEQALSPRAVEVLRAIVDDQFPEHTIKFEATAIGPATKLLCFGKAPDENPWGRKYIYTYSIAQIMTKANAASVLAAGIRQFINEPETVPFRAPTATTRPEYILARLDPNKPTAIDIETDGLLGKEQTPEEVNVISIAFYQPGQPPIVLVSDQQFERYNRTGPLWDQAYIKGMKVSDILVKFTKAIYHNGKFDIRVLNRYFNIELINLFDTMLAHHVINHAAGDHKLKTLARRYLGAPEWEADLSKYTKGGGHYELIPYGNLIEYNGWDVYWTYKLYEFLQPLIEADENNQKAFALEMAEADFLLDVEKYGIPFDDVYSVLYAKQLADGMKWPLYALQLITKNESFNPNSPQQVGGWLKSQGVNIKDTQAKTLQAWLDDNECTVAVRDFIKQQLEYKKLAKIKGTYADGWRNFSRDGRVHPTFLVHGTTTGRLSSTQPNAQNVPRDKTVRKLVKTHG
jgi:DNA polymerase I-like protein with 3'-5' exonuclease and polymerase domains